MTSIFREDALKDRVALVTGGGSGICKGIAWALVAHGARTAIVGRKAERLEAAAEELSERTSRQCLVTPADVRDPAAVERAVDATLERFGRLGVVVNGAAGNFLCPAAQLSYNGFRTVVEIDTIGTYNVSKACFDRALQKNGGSIVNISATLHHGATPLQSHAAAAKAAVDSLTRSLALEWAGLGIRVNGIAPGSHRRLGRRVTPRPAGHEEEDGVARADRAFRANRRDRDHRGLPRVRRPVADHRGHDRRRRRRLARGQPSRNGLMRRLCIAACLLAGCGSSSSDAPSAPPTPAAEPAREAPAEVPPEDESARAEAPQVAEAAPEPEPARDPNAPAPCPPESEWPEGMACVEGGTFTIGDERGRPDEREPGEVYVDTFYMDLYEVTNEQYAACIAAGLCERPMPFRFFMAPRQPVVAVSWYDANHYCEMLGKRLPTEAEWERAASGPEDTRYPWGDEPLGCERAVVKDERGEGCGRGRTWPVGSMEPGHWGLYDMAGNVHEWVYDWYSPCLRGCENECGDACFGRNPRGPCGGESPCEGYRLRSVRGGSWYWPLERARASARRGAGPLNRGPHRFGFRCARDLVVARTAETSEEAPSE